MQPVVCFSGAFQFTTHRLRRTHHMVEVDGMARWRTILLYQVVNSTSMLDHVSVPRIGLGTRHCAQFLNPRAVSTLHFVQESRARQQEKQSVENTHFAYD